MQRGRSSQGLGVFMLLMQLGRIGVRNVGPITLAIIALNVFVHYGLRGPTRVRHLCLYGPSIVEGLDLKRLITAAFVHADEMHLGYNMASFLWKAHVLEEVLGATRFLGFILYAALMSNVLLVGLSYGIGHLFGYWSTYRTCTVGFSAVLFALKVVATLQSGVASRTYVMGLFSVPSKHLYWVELLVISLLVPRASFVGHLCGLLAGLFYTSGFLEPLFRALDAAVARTAERRRETVGRSPSNSYLSGGRVQRGGSWAAEHPTYTSSVTEELADEDKRRAMREARELQQAQVNSVVHRHGHY